MLARRFTIVCPLTALWGASFSSLVSHAGRAQPSWEAAQRQAPCGFACALGSGGF
jgi:hypothetical protein